MYVSAGVKSALRHDAIVDATKIDFTIIEREADRVAARAVRMLQRSRDDYERQHGHVPFKCVHMRAAWSVQLYRRARFGPRINPPTHDTKSHNGDGEDVENTHAITKNIFTGDKLVDKKASSSGTATRASSTLLLGAIRNRKLANPMTDDEDDTLSERADCAAHSAVHVVYSAPHTTGSARRDKLSTDLCTHLRTVCGRRASTVQLLARFADDVQSRDSSVFRALLRKLCTFTREGNVGWWTLRDGY
jgi:DNA excision repair protein ERCC-6